jgi:hypothetical protein
LAARDHWAKGLSTRYTLYNFASGHRAATICRHGDLLRSARRLA